MSRFGIRKKLKSAVKSALGLDSPIPSVRTAAPPSRPESPSKPAPPPKKAAPASPPPRSAAPPSRGAPAAGSTPSANLPPGSMWVQGARLDEMVPGTCKVVTVLGRKIALYSVDGELFATENACPHAGGQLGEGDLDGHTVTCPFHAFQYDVRTGDCLGGQTDAVGTVKVRVDDNLVMFEV